MRLLLLALVTVLGGTGCRFHAGSAIGDASPDDAPIAVDGADAPGPDAPPVKLCAPDSHLRLCFSFDQPSFPAQLPDEGVAVVDAALTNVTRIPHAGGGAALLDATSEIFVPMAPEVTNILAAELWVRLDADPANNARSGLYDSNIIPPNVSMFYYRTDPGHTVQCGLGGENVAWTTTLAIGTWTYLACVCDGTSQHLYQDGVEVGTAVPGQCGTGGAFTDNGFTIGANNTGGAANPNDKLAGAIDGIRLWDTPLTATTICETAGRSGC